MLSLASSLNGSISVKSSVSGLPLAVHIETSEVRRLSPEALAQEIMRLNHLATRRAQHQYRTILEADKSSVWSKRDLDELGYPTKEQLAREEAILSFDEEEVPETWLRKV
ncbi:hypothetical protein [Segniliparus rugosus]|uniref:hypothetical protein n=1 Tax=Segniliparus rugosus TaxID=286804 RepID=UPI0001F03708